MALPAWEKFLKQNEYLKDILDKYDEIKKENAELKKENRQFKASKRADVVLKTGELEDELGYWKRQYDTKVREIDHLKNLLKEYGWEEEDEWD